MNSRVKLPDRDGEYNILFEGDGYSAWRLLKEEEVGHNYLILRRASPPPMPELKEGYRVYTSLGRNHILLKNAHAKYWTTWFCNTGVPCLAAVTEDAISEVFDLENISIWKRG